jgi:hypothetical protein
MKILSIFFILISLYSIGQNFSPGINFGFVASQVDGDRLDGYNKPGLKVGILIQNNFYDKWTFLMGIDYIQKGSRKLRNPDNPDDRYYLLRLNYIEVPALIQYKYKAKFLGELGLVFGYLFKANEDVDGYGFMEPYPPFKPYDIPIRCGLGYKLNKNLSLKFHYSYSLLPIRNHPANQTWYFNKGQYNNYLIFAIFYVFE